MAAIEFIMNGGMASTGGDLPDNEQNQCNDLIKKYGTKVKEQGRKYLIPASELSIFRMNYLFIGKDQFNYHFVFVDKPGANTIMYRDLTKHGIIPIQSLIHQLKIEIGEVHWALTIPTANINEITEEKIEEYAKQYIEAVLQAVKKQATAKISDQAISVPELGKYIEAFKSDHSGQKTAFIIMQFSKTKIHDQIVQSIKDTLKQKNIIGLRADDKEYSDDLFHNIRTYMHCCDFGIAVFERVLDDNFNPNVSLEVGYMMGLDKSVCLLKDQTLKNLPTDLVGKLYKPFDPQDVNGSLPGQLNKWMKDKGIV
jgi:nucleoside 2-deoxyribosyltransferase